MKVALQDPLLRIEDVAALTGIPVNTWRTWIASKKGPQPAKLGGRLFWRRSQIDRWLDEQFAAAAASERK
ncbi:helix-turn-helix transcriptional regulator [Nocardioides yefusunii]|uniref:Helix-turn-helix transcriptional regulator n=1 Tax=Nocardioides yefusunii TaxID=2500546 RepID=A0ABW1R0C5_9ACTN|nr:helix-turn-helix domain-containing protein [Nocardioides yefusunii]